MDVFQLPEAQQWHVPKNDEVDEPILYEDINFEKPSYEKDITGRKRSGGKNQANNFYPTPQFARQLSQDNINEFANNLKQEGKADYLRGVMESNDCQPFQFDNFHQSLPSKKRCVQLKETTLDINDCTVRDQVLEKMAHSAVNWSYVDDENVEFVGELSANHEQLKEIERNTRGQSTCDRWYEERRRRVTASNFGTIMKRRKNIYPKSLLKTLLGNPASKQYCPKPCKWGKDNEVEAVKQYIQLKQKQESDVAVCSSCGLIVNPYFPWLGASPDFVIRDPQEQASPLGLGEIKCPFSRKDNTIKEACEDPNFCLVIAQGNVLLKRSHVYFYQIQGSMATLQLQWSDFVVYTNKDLFVERIYFDNSLWEKTMVPELSNFYFDYVLPNLKSS